MTATVKQVREAIITQLRMVNGSDPYTLDLSPEGQVKGGKFERPPGVVPFACVWTVQVDEQDGPPLTNKQQVATFMVKIWVTGAAKDPENRQDAAETMLDEARTALRANRRLGSLLTLPMSVSGAPFDEAEAQSPNRQSHGVTLLAISATWRE